MGYKKRKIKVGPKAPFVNNLLILEGITRSGKFLLGNILNGFADIEPVQYSYLLEQIPFLESNNLIDRVAAKELIRCEIDYRAYETLIGRNLNYRIFDKSSVYNIPNYKEFSERSKTKNTDGLIKKFKNYKIFSPFIVHESMANIKIYFETFSQMKCISIQRNAIDLAYSWYKRGLGKRWGYDPLFFQVPFNKGRNKVFPWFALGRENSYLKSNEIDRVILSIKLLKEKSIESFSKLTTHQKKRILKIDYENLVENPIREIKRISEFLEKKPHSQIKEILKREGLPQKGLEDRRLQKFKEMKGLTNNENLDMIKNL